MLKGRYTRQKIPQEPENQLKKTDGIPESSARDRYGFSQTVRRKEI